MPEYQVLAILAALAFLYSLVASRLERTAVSGALVYSAAGLVCGPVGLRLIDLQIDGEAIRWLAELTLAVVLFTDAANANLKVLGRFEAIPVRLLMVGLPLTILIGFGIGWALFPELSMVEIALLAIILAPTDAALGKAVVTNKAVPAPIRESLNVESGLNDGICVPVLLLFLALAQDQVKGWEAAGLAITLPVQAIGIGVGMGLALGTLGSFALRACSKRDWVTGSWLQIPVIALAMLCFASAQCLGGSGFIASFVGGMTFGALTKEHKGEVLEAAEGTGDILAMLTWFAFGTMLFRSPFDQLSWRMFVYVVASLTLIRMLPVFVSVAGLRLRKDSKLFMGWFGPRGLASIVFAVMVANEHLPNKDLVVTITAWTILFSVVSHGLSANFLSAIYGTRASDPQI
ncbi:sodium:proton antiporter [bacterium]|nr:sodium:proton antiporter [bacterium]